MPVKLPAGVEISVSRRSLPADYQMPTMDMAVDHYAMGFLLSGDRRTITAQQTYDTHAGDVSMMPPFVYHRTVSLSAVPYENYLIKFSATAVEPLIRLLGAGFLDEMMAQKIHRFREDARARVLWLFEEMNAVYAADAAYSGLLLQGLLLRLLTMIHEERIGGAAERFPSELSKPVIDTLARIEAHYGEDLRLSDVAGEIGYSEAHLSRLFTAQLGVGFSAYLARVRLRHVCELLSGTEEPVGAIALACGYCSGDYLAARFREKMGMAPREFRRQAQRQRSRSPASAAAL